MSQQSLPLPKSKHRQRLASALSPSSSISSTLPISSLSNMNAMSYLSAVNLEAQQLPTIFSSKTSISSHPSPKPSDSSPPIDGTQACLSVLFSHHTDIPKCSSVKLLPKSPTKWTDAVLHDFSNLRRYVSDLSTIKRERQVVVPPMREKLSWHEFCLGSCEAEGNVGGYFDDDDEEDDDNEEEEEEEEEIAGEENPNWKKNLPVGGYPPRIRLLLQMDQVMTRRVLYHHIDYLCEDGYQVTERRMVWLYSLLARIEKPLLGEDDAMMRKLLRECCRRRGESEGNRRILACLDVVIVVLGYYFEQGGGVMEAPSCG